MLAALEHERRAVEQELVTGRDDEIVRLEDDPARAAGFRNSKPSVRRRFASSPRAPRRRHAAPSPACRSGSASPAPASPSTSCSGTAPRSARAARCRRSPGRAATPRPTRARPSRAARRATARRRRTACGPPSSSTAVVTASRNHRSCATRIDGRVERCQLPLEPLEALDVEVVRRLVEQQQVGVGRQRARERGARQLAAGERVERPVEIGVAEPEAAEDRCGTVAPGPAARVLEPRLRLAVAAQRRRRVVASRPSPARAARAPPRSRRGRPRPTASTRGASDPARVAAVGRAARRACPSRTRARRPVSDVSPMIARSSVVLPAPFGPASASRSPRRSRNETPSKRGSPENSFREPGCDQDGHLAEGYARIVADARVRNRVRHERVLIRHGSRHDRRRRRRSRGREARDASTAPPAARRSSRSSPPSRTRPTAVRR